MVYELMSGYSKTQFQTIRGRISTSKIKTSE